MKPVKTCKAIALTLCAVITALLCACSPGSTGSGNIAPTEPAAKEYTLSPTHKVIIDTDTGADDASALILAAKAPNIDILGVTTLAGNVDLEQSTGNALAALEIAGSDAPVFPGSAENCSGENIDAFSVFGSDGMGDADLIHPTGEAGDMDAIDFILQTVSADPGEVEIVMLGPATNIAKAIERDPDTMKKVKRIWSMGTTGYGHGNASPAAEFNVYHDPIAYKTVLDSGIDITVIGLDMCTGGAAWTDEQFALLDSTNEIGHFVCSSFAKLRAFYAGNNTGGRTSNCDALAMLCVVYEDFVGDTIRCYGSCITEKGETYGEVLLYREGFTYDVAANDFDHNVTLVTGVAEDDCFDLYLRTIS